MSRSFRDRISIFVPSGRTRIHPQSSGTRSRRSNRRPRRPRRRARTQTRAGARPRRRQRHRQQQRLGTTHPQEEPVDALAERASGNGVEDADPRKSASAVTQKPASAVPRSSHAFDTRIRPASRVQPDARRRRSHEEDEEVAPLDALEAMGLQVRRVRRPEQDTDGGAGASSITKRSPRSARAASHGDQDDEHERRARASAGAATIAPAPRPRRRTSTASVRRTRVRSPEWTAVAGTARRDLVGRGLDPPVAQQVEAPPPPAEDEGQARGADDGQSAGRAQVRNVPPTCRCRRPRWRGGRGQCHRGALRPAGRGHGDGQEHQAPPRRTGAGDAHRGPHDRVVAMARAVVGHGPADVGELWDEERDEGGDLTYRRLAGQFPTGDVATHRHGECDHQRGERTDQDMARS